MGVWILLDSIRISQSPHLHSLLICFLPESFVCVTVTQDGFAKISGQGCHRVFVAQEY